MQASAYLMLFSFPTCALADTLFGSVRMEGGSSAGLTVRVMCQGRESGKAMTDAHGSFNMRVQSRGRCEMTVSDRAGVTGRPAIVFVGDKPSRFDLTVDRSMNPRGKV